ncbi:MAG: hypothetical protein J5966_10455 [Lachnospiraceae bacterium]|nr:hypothetical protein [Lachnospiraceae bacterium]
MDRRQYDLAFDKQFINMKYSEALEVVGAMKYSGIPKARYLEMLLYYERGEFEKIRNTLKGKRIDNVEEREFYLVSLIELRQYDEFESYYNEFEAISEACLDYIESLMWKQGYHMPVDHKAVMDYKTYFDKRYRWFVADQIADIFNLNEEKLMLIDAGMPAADINELTRKITDLYETIKLKDAVIELIKKYTDDNQPIPADNVLYMPLLYTAQKSRLDDIFRGYDALSDIALCLELSRKIHMPEVEVNTVSRYWKEISESVRDGNMYMISLLAEIYSDIGYLKNPDTGKIYSLLKKEAPFVINDIENHSMNPDIESTLSESGRFAYKAAGWNLCNAVKNRTVNREDHVICLAFMRLLEMEINERIIFPLCDSINIRQSYEEFRDKLNDVEKGEFVAEWEYRISSLEKVDRRRNKRLRFAGIITLFDSLRYKRYKRDSFHREFAGELRTEINRSLTEEGVTALADGSFAKIVEPEKLELFRNVSRESRYSGFEIALECRSYVETELLRLAEYVKQNGSL